MRLFGFDSHSLVISVPGRERWLVVVAGSCLLIANAGAVVGMLYSRLGFIAVIVGLVIALLLCQRWNAVPAHVRQDNHRRNFLNFALFLFVFLMLIPLVAEEFLVNGWEVALPVYVLVVSIPHAAVLVQMYKRAGENAPPSPFEPAHGVDEQ